MNIKEIVSQFTDTSVNKIGVYMVHLERAKEREGIIKELFEKLKITPDSIHGIEGKDIVNNGHPTRSRAGHDHGNGQIGCIASHIEICKKALQEGKEYAIIFEDDTILEKPLEEVHNILSGIKGFFKTYSIKWDIFLLGALGYPSFFPNSMGISPIYEFHGSHALIINRKIMKRYIELYFNSISINQIEATDCVYSDILREGAVGIGFSESKLLFSQKQEGMYSYIREYAN